jgi:Mn-dependent DtxR family transcriptional regulator
MPKPETVGAIISLITEDRDDFDAETIKGVIESTYELIDEKKHVTINPESIKRILEEFISQGYVQKSGDKYLVTTQGRQAYKDMWKSLDPLTEAYFAGAYAYYEAKKEEAENKQHNTRPSHRKKRQRQHRAGKKAHTSSKQ